MSTGNWYTSKCLIFEQFFIKFKHQTNLPIKRALMYYRILQLLNIKPSESALVRELFTIQFFLGIATAFLFTSSLTMFISHYEINVLPVSFILSAILLFVFNRIY